MSDAELIGRLARRDAGALEQLYDRYSRPVYSLLVRIVGEPLVAEDLLQEAFLRLWNRSSAFDASRGALGSWLLTLARNLALDHLRSKAEKQRRREEAVEILPAHASSPEPENWVDQQRQWEHVRVRMAELPEAQRRALELAYFGGLSHSEIAQTMAEPLGTVKTWLRNALLRLRQEVEPVT